MFRNYESIDFCFTKRKTRENELKGFRLLPSFSLVLPLLKFYNSKLSKYVYHSLYEK